LIFEHRRAAENAERRREKKRRKNVMDALIEELERALRTYRENMLTAAEDAVDAARAEDRAQDSMGAADAAYRRASALIDQIKESSDANQTD
jgi:hypothetical protein